MVSPKRYWIEPVKSGPYKGEYLAHKTWDKTLDDYYRLHSWDVESGLQTSKGLEKLGLEAVADRLEAAGILKH